MVMVSAAYAQPGGGGPGGRGGMFGMFGGGFNPMATPGAEVYLLASDGVQKELAVTDDQKTKTSDLAQEARDNMRTQMRSMFQSGVNFQDMTDEERTKFRNDMQKKTEESGKKIEEKLAKILDTKQMDRLKQLQLQMQGVQALTTPAVVDKLKLSKDAQDKIKKVIDDAQNNRPQFDYRNATDDERKDFIDKMQKQRKETMASALKSLDDDQLVEWGTMIGKEFKFDAGPGMFGGGFFGGRGGRGGPGGGPNNQGGNNNPQPQNN
jgi:hypothetical protein